MPVIISNTSPVIALAHIGNLELILKVFNIEKFYITSEVFEELKDKTTKDCVSKLIAANKLEVLPKANNSEELNSIAIEIAMCNPKADPKSWKPEQHRAEASVILKGKELGADFLIMDDFGGRQITATKGLKRMTHFNILKQAVNKGIISKPEGRKHLLALIDKGYKYGNIEHYMGEWCDE